MGLPGPQGDEILGTYASQGTGKPAWAGLPGHRNLWAILILIPYMPKSQKSELGSLVSPRLSQHSELCRKAASEGCGQELEVPSLLSLFLG